jgi:hypothetical protein
LNTADSLRSAMPFMARSEEIPFQKNQREFSPHPRGRGSASSAAFNSEGIGRNTGLPLFSVSQEHAPAPAILADAVPRKQRNVADAERRIAKRQDHGAGAKPLIRAESDTVAGVDDRRNLTRRKRFDVVRFDVARGLDARCDILPAPFAVTAEPAELAQQLKLLHARDGFKRTTGAERVEVSLSC